MMIMVVGWVVLLDLLPSAFFKGLDAPGPKHEAISHQKPVASRWDGGWHGTIGGGGGRCVGARLGPDADEGGGVPRGGPGLGPRPGVESKVGWRGPVEACTILQPFNSFPPPWWFYSIFFFSKPNPPGCRSPLSSLQSEAL